MKIEDLKNTKIHLPNVKDRRLFQEKVFQLGVKWRDGTAEIKHIGGDVFYYIDEGFNMTIDCGIGCVSWFLRKRNKQIFLDEVLSIGEPKTKHAFKPFDKVLVRDFDNDRWKPRWFSWFDSDNSKNPAYETTDGCFHNQCIPYSEELVNTNKKPKP